MNEAGNVVTKASDIRDRAFEFSVRIAKLCKYKDKRSCVSRNLIMQLLDGATSNSL